MFVLIHSNVRLVCIKIGKLDDLSTWCIFVLVRMFVFVDARVSESFMCT